MIRQILCGGGLRVGLEERSFGPEGLGRGRFSETHNKVRFFNCREEIA